MQTAQERFASLLKDRWGPTLREMGFKGSGKRWTLPDDNDWVMLSFQTSTASSSQEAKFTLNLLVVGKDEWDQARQEYPWLATTPNPNRQSVHRYNQRAGFLTHGHDYWWRLPADGSQDAQVGNEIDQALRDLVVPALREQMRQQDTRSIH